jgi:5-formyltetrahydrofolate cyclo-ligase
MLRRDDQNAVGSSDLVFETGHRGRRRRFMLLIVQRQVVYPNELGIELVGTESDERTRKPAVERIPTVAADDHGDARLGHCIGHADSSVAKPT